MKVINIHDLPQQDLYFCDDENIKDYIVSKNIIYINKTNKYWIFVKCNDLENALKQFYGKGGEWC